uniref:Uncharacterized protein n=1 Tax=Anguilla anguilla TaxID=7936 RepID=A0A0E9XU90_ANGAN
MRLNMCVRAPMSESKKEIHGIHKINCKRVGLSVCVFVFVCMCQRVCEFK